MARGLGTGLPGRIERLLTSRHVFLRLITTTTALTISAGVLISIVDREEFPSVWLGMWWAIQTVSTVGYGDVTPRAVEGRIIAAFVMIVGVGFISLITATVASSLISRVREGEDVRDQQVAAGVERLERRLDELERLLRER
jgi:voltage-gated potassium channel